MMPNQPRESGMAQNNGVIEARWGESLPVWLAVGMSISLMSTGLETPQQRPFFPSGMDVTSFS